MLPGSGWKRRTEKDWREIKDRMRRKKGGKEMGEGGN